MFEYVACSVKGTGRDKNEDRVMVNNAVLSEGTVSGYKENSFISVVCDGVGGTRGGDFAAEMVASGFVEYEIEKASAYSLNRHILSINASVENAQRLFPKYKRMASTVAGIVFWEKNYLMFNLGDTRIYEIKDGSIILKSRDHVIIKDNIGVPRRARGDALTRYIGGFGHACRPNIIKGCVSGKESLFLVCTDGIHKKIPEDVLKDILLEESSLEEKKRAIIEIATRNGSIDDMSIVLMKYKN